MRGQAPLFNCLVLALAAAVGACAPRAKPGDIPALRLGVDACARCGMIVSEERFAAGYVDDEGRSVIYDDVGEFLQAVQASPALKSRSFVHDAMAGGWLPASTAVYKKIEGLPTPMGSGFAAFRDEYQAATLAARLSGGARAGTSGF